MRRSITADLHIHIHGWVWRQTFVFLLLPYAGTMSMKDALHKPPQRLTEQRLCGMDVLAGGRCAGGVLQGRGQYETPTWARDKGISPIGEFRLVKLLEFDKSIVQIGTVNSLPCMEVCD